jgi:hypothetical protein
VPDPGSTVEVAALLKARGRSIRLLLLGAAAVLGGVLYNIWSTVSLMRVVTPTSVSRTGPSEFATDFLLYGGYGPYLLPLAVLLLCGCFVLIIRTPLVAAGSTVWKRPSGRFDELQGELVALAVLAGVVALGYAGVALIGFAVSESLTSVEMARGICATVLASSAATLCLAGVLLTYWWILGDPQPVTPIPST